MLQAVTTRCPSRADAAGAAILDRTAAAFERRLDRGSGAPIAVGFSGGGDSLALLLAARAWASSAGRPLLALTVDHGLNSQSRAWTARAGEVAQGLGASFLALAWTGDKPRTGLQAAARRARHALLAEAARQAGASVLLLGHTLDDVREAAWMRGQGSSVGIPREWAPSPAWPEGRGVFLLRPLLGRGRAELRERLVPSGLDWIEDPANDDGRFLRTHARRSGPLDAPEVAPHEPPAVFHSDVSGATTLPRDCGRRLLAMACVCAGGGERLPRGREVERLIGRLAQGEVFVATLAGARLQARDEILVTRDAGRIAAAPQALPVGAPVIWDGRFEVAVAAAGLSVRPLGGLMSRLETNERAALALIPAPARPALPAVIDADGNVTCPILAQGPWSSARTLVFGRLAASCGQIAREPALAPGPHGERDPGALS